MPNEYDTTYSAGCDCEINYYQVDSDEFEQLVEVRREFQILLNILMQSAKLSWDGKELEYREEPINAILKALVPQLVANRLEDLQREKEDRKNG